MTDRIKKRVADLRERAGEFNSLMAQLQKMRPALHSDKSALDQWRQLMLDGNAIRAAIKTSARMIDGANKWVGRAFQRKALDAIPFAADVVHSATNGSISAIEHFIERAQKAIQKFTPLFEQFLKLGKKEQAKLAALPVETAKQGVAPALILIAVLGGLVFLANRFGDQKPEFFDYD